MQEYTRITLLDEAEAYADSIDAPKPEGLQWYLKAVGHDLRTYNDYLWPPPGVWAVCSDELLNREHTGPCPSREGDGLCVAKTWEGMASGGTPALTGLLVGVVPKDILGEEGTKLRARSVYVRAVLDLPRLMRESAYLGGAYLGGANLYGAYLRGAYLGGANLYGAYLGGAYLGGANLRGANLGGANLGGANLGGANLGGANLGRAYLGGANLGGADLRGANLYGAYLGGANLYGAYLGGANLGGADLRGANLGGAYLGGAINYTAPGDTS